MLVICRAPGLRPIERRHRSSRSATYRQRLTRLVTGSMVLTVPYHVCDAELRRWHELASSIRRQLSDHTQTCLQAEWVRSYNARPGLRGLSYKQLDNFMRGFFETHMNLDTVPYFNEDEWLPGQLSLRNTISAPDRHTRFYLGKLVLGIPL